MNDHTHTHRAHNKLNPTKWSYANHGAGFLTVRGFIHAMEQVGLSPGTIRQVGMIAADKNWETLSALPGPSHYDHVLTKAQVEALMAGDIAPGEATIQEQDDAADAFGPEDKGEFAQFCLSCLEKALSEGPGTRGQNEGGFGDTDVGQTKDQAQSNI